ncbi:hypothetical protein [Microvirga terricola]|uniref:DUF5808 domain-containing protein n=1 Tax=Microvirga terricola TaxID=2719797 RepID=A0ABX0V748_9HYPH|nr:hypothetical protein [Microvirga terricola]NIX75408.1 hypothetical protein [Microvirga terricola]
MSMYRFGRFGSLLRDDHPIALYVGGRRLSPPPRLVWWFPWNWVVAAIALPIAVVRAVRDVRVSRIGSE